MIGTLPRIQDLLMTTIPSSIFENLSNNIIRQNKTMSVLNQVENLFGMQLINKGISMCALPLIITQKENHNWRMCIDSQALFSF